MDSVTQFALGATISAALLGPKIGPRKAIVLGGLLGTVPDLDTFLPVDNPVTAFTSHRGATHSLVVHATLAVVCAEPLVRAVKSLRDHRILTYLAVYLIFATHALIDGITVYGTRLLWPIDPAPYAVGSMFIIDPLYTIPLIIVVIWALFLSDYTARFRKWVWGALAVSTAYMLVSIPIQGAVEDKARAILADRGVKPERLIAIPTPFNILYWKAIAVDGPRYINLYISALRDGATIYVHPRRTDLMGCLANDPVFQELATFSKGFYNLETEGRDIVMSDLRMGMTPNYVFRFKIAEHGLNGAAPVDVPTRLETIRGADGDFAWLWAGLTGSGTTRPAETNAEISIAELAPAGPLLAMTQCAQPQLG